LSEKTIDAEIGETFRRLKTLLAKTNSKVIYEQDSAVFSVIQGSLWGTSPEAAQKKITFTLQQKDGETHVRSVSALTSDYVRLTLAGYALSFVLIIVCAWIAIDLQMLASTGALSLWSWLGQTGGVIDASKVAVFIRLMWILVAFLAVTLVAESIIIWNVRKKISAFAEKRLHELANIL